MLFLPMVAALLAQDTTDPGPGDTRSDDHTHAQGQAQRQAQSESHAAIHPHGEADTTLSPAEVIDTDDTANKPEPPPRPTLRYYTSQVVLFANWYCPLGTVEADGGYYQVNEVMELSALIGSRFGGDNINTILIPDLRGRTPLGAQGYRDPAYGGMPYQTVGTPAHSHVLRASSEGVSQASPTDGMLPTNSQPEDPTPYTSPVNAQNLVEMGSETISMQPYTPSGDPINTDASTVDLYQPHLNIRFCFVPQGVFPQRQ